MCRAPGRERQSPDWPPVELDASPARSRRGFGEPRYRGPDWRLALPATPKLVLTLLAALLLTPRPSHGQDDLSVEAAAAGPRATFELGVLLGGGFYQMNAPDDPAGSTTFLFGSSFSGGAFTAGLTAFFDLADIPLGFGLDLLYTRSSETGFAETEFGRREITFDQNLLQILLPAVRAHFELAFGAIELTVGPEIAVGLGADASETVSGSALPADPLETDQSLAVFLVAQLGIAVRVGGFGPFEHLSLPVQIRFGANPFYPDRTSERFESFVSPEQPGAMTIGADWYLTGLVGLRFANAID